MQERKQSETHSGNGRGRAGKQVALGFAAALAFGMGCAPAPAPPPIPGQIETYRVGPPDKLSVTILPEPVIRRSVYVRPDGKISIDLIGDVQAAGRTVEEIARDIEQRIARYKRNPRVTVAVSFSRSSMITIFGEVGHQTSLPVERRTRVAEAIALVGGPGRFAAKSRIRVIRFDGERTRVIHVDLRAIERGDLRTNILLQGGDIVVVPPTVLARTGYAISALFFPFQQLLGVGARVATTVVTGGAGAAIGR